MKKIILTLIIFTIPCFLVAKKSSQLVFKSVKSFQHVEYSRWGGMSNKYYKPDSGTVWKIEKIINGKAAQVNSPSTVAIYFGTTKMVFDDGGPFPLWIGENDSFSFDLAYNTTSKFLVSALEFQVVD